MCYCIIKLYYTTHLHYIYQASVIQTATIANSIKRKDIKVSGSLYFYLIKWSVWLIACNCPSCERARLAFALSIRLVTSGGRYQIWFNSMFEFCQKAIHSIFDSILFYQRSISKYYSIQNKLCWFNSKDNSIP